MSIYTSTPNPIILCSLLSTSPVSSLNPHHEYNQIITRLCQTTHTMTTSLASLLLLLTAFTTSTPLSRRNLVQCYEAPPILAFAPYETVACEQSFVPGQPNHPPIFNLTQNYCQDAPYQFGSYFTGGTEAKTTGEPAGCELAIYGNLRCRGDIVVRSVDAFDDCVIPEVEGWSVMLTCPAA